MSSDDGGAAARALEVEGVGKIRSVEEALTAWKEVVFSEPCKPYVEVL